MGAIAQAALADSTAARALTEARDLSRVRIRVYAEPVLSPRRPDGAPDIVHGGGAPTLRSRIDERYDTFPLLTITCSVVMNDATRV